MPNKLTIASVVIAAVAALALTRALRQGGRTQAPPRPADDQSTAEIAQLKAELRSLKGNVASQGVLLANALDRSGAPGVPASAEGPGQQPSATPTTAEIPPKEIFAKLDQRFYAEPANAVATQKLSATLTRLVPAGSSLGRIDCRDSLCRIEATHDNRDAYGSFVHATFLGRQTGLWPAGFTSELLEETPTASKSVTFFGAREGAEIPPLEELGLHP
jgi:hypothetical protein